jgi:tetratricopeptide (TPR) repeat protein
LLLCLGTASPTFAQDPAPRRLTFGRDIAPIISDKCTSCHRRGGGAPFALTEYADVRSRATLIAQVTRARVMPPWKPQAPVGVFLDDRRLTQEQIARIQRWVDEGAVLGDEAPRGDAGSAGPRIPGSPTANGTREWELGTPDLVVTMPQAFTLPAEGKDTIRSFVVPVPAGGARYVRGIEFHPDVVGVVHHANIKIDVTGSSRRIDADDDEPGFDGSGPNARFPDGQFLGWTPGQRPHVSDDNVWVLPAGADLVIEIHLTPTGKPERVQSSVGLLFSSQPPRRMPSMVRLGNQRLDIPAGERRYVSRDAYVLPVDVDVLAVQPHAHNLARTVTGSARLPDGRTEPLIEIADWDFRWQDVYRYTRPIHLPRGTTLEMTYTYDNSDQNARNPHRPPRRVTFGQTTDAEMGDLWFQVATSTPPDRAMLEADIGPKMLREDTAGDEMMVAVSPEDARLRRDLASCYAADGRVDDAIVQLRRAVALDPASADGHYELGTLLLGRRRLDEAAVSLERAVALKPEWSESHTNLGAVWFLRGDLSAAMRSFDEALRRDPANAQAHYNRGRVLVAEGKPDAALVAFKESLRWKSADADTLTSAAAALVATGQVSDGVRYYRDALRLQPDLVSALTDLAWILASAEPHDRARAEEAVTLAERAAKLTSFENAIVLDTLGASYFAAGRVDEAIRTAERAVDVAQRGGEAQAVRDITSRLNTYRRRRPD